MRLYYYIFLCFLLIPTVWSCSNIEDANPSDKNSFIRFYEGPTGQQGIITLPDEDGGFIIAGNIIRDNTLKDIIVIKSDKSGNKLWQKVISNGTVSSIRQVPDGYFIIGDRIEYDPNSSVISEIQNTDARLIKMDLNGNITSELLLSDSIYTDSDTLHVDFHGSSINTDNNGNIYYLGSFKGPLLNNYERSFVVVLNSSFQRLWSQNYLLQDRDYRNCNSIYLVNNTDLLWATTSYKASQNLASAYMSIVFAKSNSTFENNDLLGENDTRNHIAYDLKASGYQYGIIGTYAENNGDNANIYFAKVNTSGSIIPGSERYFDGASETIQLAITDRDLSESQDEGKAITGTRDGGFVLACTRQSIPGNGNGGQDILLIKIDAFGNIGWHKLIGGSGDEVVGSISETTDESLVLCGTNTVNGLSTIFLMKTDKNGELKN